MNGGKVVSSFGSRTTGVDGARSAASVTARNRGSAFLAALWLGVLLAASLGGCGGAPGSTLEEAGLDSEYVSIESMESYVVLLLSDDGSFAIIRDEVVPYGAEGRFRRGPEALGTGSWSFSDGLVELDGGEWRTTLRADSTRVAIPARADTIKSLTWVTGSGGSPLSAFDLVSASEFEEFLHPKGGTGSTGG
jgi:hypothetical protein